MADTSNTAPSAVEVRAVKKAFGAGAAQVVALKTVSLTIADNEFFTLLGPSGCGKTTLLRLIAGFEQPTDGEILLFGEHLEGLPPNKRPVNTVFQHYALFPHMTIAENVAFGLRRLKKSEAEVKERVQRMLELVKLAHTADRRPNQLSGGQQQRIALARALAPGPKVLLLDEPLSALDLKLRQAMRAELKQMQQETGITFVFVTHDQEEALTMSDRIAVMSAGELQQVGGALDIYEAPRNRFVADFIGETNLLDVTVEEVRGEEALCRIGSHAVLPCSTAGPATAGTSGHVSIRPERLSLSKPNGDDAIVGQVERLIYLGTDTQYLLRLDDGTVITVRAQNAHDSRLEVGPGERAALKIDAGASRLLVD
ncbi:MAG: ABC transporter ATP-binding protein [Pseudomonadota bacterium]